ncbi:transglutaminase domain-containing protein [Flavobacterium sp.]|uniref:transglutaminase domain-containing protein n=1 Tax=Flavobacterium sp. TaxID=239 RepID=UPI0039E645AA
MKKTIATQSKALCLLLLLFGNTLFAQDYSKVDNLVKTYPKSFSNPNKLAEKINADFKTDEEKVRAAFTWIALHVNYDLKAYQSGGNMIAYTYSGEADRLAKEKQYRLEYAEKTLRTKKGVCQDYSALFHVVCDAIGVKCIDIIGTSKAHPSHIGKLPKANDHEWNAVKIDDQWKFIDVTWASGSVDLQTGKFKSEFNDGYFFTEPEVFFLNHFPQDKRLLMIQKSEQQFAELPLFYGAYIKAGYEIATPEKGIISASTAPILFQVIDFPGGDLSYDFSSEGIFHEIQSIQKGNATEFSIPMTSRSRGFLTVYVNQQAVVTYKIER